MNHVYLDEIQHTLHEDNCKDVLQISSLVEMQVYEIVTEYWLDQEEDESTDTVYVSPVYQWEVVQYKGCQHNDYIFESSDTRYFIHKGFPQIYGIRL
jgi:hypothetical protein